MLICCIICFLNALRSASASHHVYSSVAKALHQNTAPQSMTQACLLVEPKIMIHTNTPSRILCYCIINVKSTLILSFPFCYAVLMLRNFRFCHDFMLNYCSDFENKVWSRLKLRRDFEAEFWSVFCC